MTAAVIKVFGRFGEAEYAREQWLAAGFNRDKIQLTSNDDEAGAVHGSPVTGAADSERERSSGDLDPAAGPDDHVYEREFKQVVQRGNYVLMVLPENQEQALHARRVVEEAGPGGEG